MAVSDTAVFNLNFDEMFKAAASRVGAGAQVSGYEGRGSRRAIQLMISDWMNRGIQMWAITPFTGTLLQNVVTFEMPADCVDVSDISILTPNTQQAEILMVQIGRNMYQGIAVKTAKGRPNQFLVDRQREITTLSVYPTPDRDYEIKGYYRRRLMDVNSLTDNLDIPFRYYEAAVAGLAYYMSREVTGVDEARIARLRDEYMDVLQQASDADQDKSDLWLAPNVSIYYQT